MDTMSGDKSYLFGGSNYFLNANYLLSIKYSLSGPFYNYKNKCLKMISTHIRKNNIHEIYSIGCGTCIIEDLLIEQNKNITVTGYDPNPFSCYTTDINGNTTYTGNVILNKKELSSSDVKRIGKSECVFIFWPNPNQEINYDFAALEYLLPDSFCITYGPCGCSGSNKLINALSSQDDSHTDIEPQHRVSHTNIAPFIKIKNCEYVLVCALNETVGCGYGWFGKTSRLVIYKKRELMENNYIPKIYKKITKI